MIVIGSGPAGIAAAEAFRQRDATGSVLIVTEDPHPPYLRPPLSKEYLRGTSSEVEMHPPAWFADRRIELVHARQVDAIDATAQEITADGIGHRYQSLVLACGSSPVPLPVPGGEQALALRSLADAHRLREAAAQAGSAVVIGAGFIGCEAAASLASRGVPVTLLSPEPTPQAKRLGTEAGQRILRILSDAGVRYQGETRVQAIADGAVHLDDGTAIESDLILAATGVKPRSELARATHLVMNGEHVVVRSDMRTSSPHVYAAGDVAQAFNTGAGRPLSTEHWQDAADQGTIAGENAAGGSAKWHGVPGFWSTIGDTTLKYHAWGDGYEKSRLVAHHDGFTVWYEAGGVTVGALTCNADEDYDEAETVILSGKPPPVRS